MINTVQPSMTAQATATQFPTSTIQPTATIFVPSLTPIPTLIPAASGSGGNAVCSCSSNSLNCGDFSTHNSAQACYDYCKGQGVGDIHKLDGNNDGNACESLP